MNAWVLQGEHEYEGRILLVSPPDTPDRLVLGRRKGRLWEVSLGMLALASALARDGWHFENARSMAIDEMVARVESRTWIGLSAYPSNYSTAIEWGVAARQAGAHRVVLGGPYATSRAGQILSRQHVVDFVVSGPGEEALPRLMSGAEPSSIAGVSFRDAAGMVHSIPRHLLPLSDRPLVRRSLWPGGRDQTLLGRPCAPVYFADGCPIALKDPCIFCSINHPERLSRRTPEQVSSELNQLAGLGFAAVEDGADDFPSGSGRTIRWIEELAELMEGDGLDFAWLIHATSRGLAYAGMIPALARIGVRIVQIGFESGEASLKIALKTSTEMEERVVQGLRDMGMSIYGAWVIGMPGETERTMERSIDQMRALRAMGMLCGVLLDPLWPGPGSPAFEQLCAVEPRLSACDYVPAEELLALWFRHFTRLSVEQVLSRRAEALAALEDIPITGSMLY